jgi:hypothetical protein
MVEGPAPCLAATMLWAGERARCLEDTEVGELVRCPEATQAEGQALCPEVT